MKPNRLREIWAEGRPVLNGWCSIGDPFVAETMASMGWDALTIDLQHGLIGYAEMLAMLQAVAASNVTPIVRVSWNAPGEIMKALDAGAYGVICPMVNTRAECEAFVGACRYPPGGYRSFGPTRAALSSGPGYAEEANDEILTFAMIETVEALANVAEIVATPGLNAVYVGPSDLSLSMGGKPDQDSQDPVRLAAYDTILSACKATGVRAGIHTTSAAYSQQMIARGFDLVTVGSDAGYLQSGRRDARAMQDFVRTRAG
jgi:4-hydroxy-2-oxoheptanedioate aldolase